MADRNGDGKGYPAVFTPSTGTWGFYDTVTQTSFSVSFGQSGDIPAIGDFDGA